MRVLKPASAYLPTAHCYLLVDREFIGDAWLTPLCQQSVDFVIRLRQTTRY